MGSDIGPSRRRCSASSALQPLSSMWSQGAVISVITITSAPVNNKGLHHQENMTENDEQQIKLTPVPGCRDRTPSPVRLVAQTASRNTAASLVFSPLTTTRSANPAMKMQCRTMMIRVNGQARCVVMRTPLCDGAFSVWRCW